MKIYSKAVAINEAKECQRLMGGIWCVVEYPTDFEVVQESNIQRIEKDNIIFRTEGGKEVAA